MVLKTCIICGKEFDARRSAKCCSPECSKKNSKAAQQRFNENHPDYQKEYRQSEKGKAAKKKANQKYAQSEKGKAAQKKANQKYTQSEKGKAAQKKYAQSEKGKAAQQRFKKNNPGYKEKRTNEEIAELCDKYNGDLEQILENCPTSWQVREAKMQVWFSESYANGMIAKIKSSPVCEVTGESGDLVIHHLNSFNTHPELGNDPENMVRITKAVHKEFHKIFGYGNNTPEQWNEFVENFYKKEGGDNI